MFMQLGKSLNETVPNHPNPKCIPYTTRNPQHKIITFMQYDQKHTISGLAPLT